jgi:hypothetical protein
MCQILELMPMISPISYSAIKNDERRQDAGGRGRHLVDPDHRSSGFQSQKRLLGFWVLGWEKQELLRIVLGMCRQMGTRGRGPGIGARRRNWFSWVWVGHRSMSYCSENEFWIAAACSEPYTHLGIRSLSPLQGSEVFFGVTGGSRARPRLFSECPSGASCAAAGESVAMLDSSAPEARQIVAPGESASPGFSVWEHQSPGGAKEVALGNTEMRIRFRACCRP